MLSSRGPSCRWCFLQMQRKLLIRGAISEVHMWRDGSYFTIIFKALGHPRQGHLTYSGADYEGHNRSHDVDGKQA